MQKKQRHLSGKEIIRQHKMKKVAKELFSNLKDGLQYPDLTGKKVRIDFDKYRNEKLSIKFSSWLMENKDNAFTVKGLSEYEDFGQTKKYGSCYDLEGVDIFMFPFSNLLDAETGKPFEMIEV